MRAYPKAGRLGLLAVAKLSFMFRGSQARTGVAGCDPLKLALGDRSGV